MNFDPGSALAGVRARMAATLAAWASAVAIASATGALARIPPILLAPAIVAGILVPTSLYGRSPLLRAAAREVGVHRISLPHAWRIVAGAMFLIYGAQDKLPRTFVLRAGWGDIFVGAFATALIKLPRTRATYATFHAVGFADFILAVGTGLAATLRREPKMRAMATFPLALVPLFGVGVSGTAHLVAFDLLRRERIAAESVSGTITSGNDSGPQHRGTGRGRRAQ